MDEIIMRRLKHLQRLEENHERDFLERFGGGKSIEDQKRERLADELSADWNRKRNAPASFRPLPEGWRREHWKTQQAIAADYTGVAAQNKKEAVQALETYEAELPVPPECTIL